MGLHVVFGAGQIGAPLAMRLREHGHDVRLVRRAGGAPPGITLASGDAGDPAFAAAATHGAEVVYHCMNPAYEAGIWALELPRLMESLIAAAGRAGARLVVLDNLYMLGDGGGKPLHEDTPVQPRSRKGEIRARVAERLFAAHRAGEVCAVSGRAADFYGPGATQSYFGDAFWPRVLAGDSAQFPANPDMPHSYHCTSDVIAGLETLGAAPEEACGRWWMLPVAPPESTRALVARFAAALGREIRIQRVPKWMLKTLGLAMPLMREIVEMSYQWDAPFVADDRQFRARFHVTPTSLDDGARATVTWARKHYGRPAAGGTS